MKSSAILPFLLIVACAVEQFQEPTCLENNDGLILPAGFCAVVVADSLGWARHLMVQGNGNVYVADSKRGQTWRILYTSHSD